MPLLKLVMKLMLHNCVMTMMERPLLKIALGGSDGFASVKDGSLDAIVLPAD